MGKGPFDNLPHHPRWSKKTEKTMEEVRRQLPPRIVRGPKRKNDPDESRWEKGRGFPTSFVFDKKQYLLVCYLANQEGISRKEMIYRLINEGLYRYNSGEMSMDFENDFNK